MLKSISGFVAALMCVCVVEVPFALNANAGMISTSQFAGSMASQRAQVARFTQRQDVQKQLIKFGVSPSEAQDRVNNLTDSEIQRVSAEINKLPAGQDTIVISLSTILLIILIILLLR